jgi:hypothetical protein
LPVALVHAPFVRRLAARIIDLLFALVVTVLVGPAAPRKLLISLPFVLASTAGGARGDRALDALAGVDLLTLLAGPALAAAPPQRRRTPHDLAGDTRDVTALKRRTGWQQDLRPALPDGVDPIKRVRPSGVDHHRPGPPSPTRALARPGRGARSDVVDPS